MSEINTSIPVAHPATLPLPALAPGAPNVNENFEWSDADKTRSEAEGLPRPKTDAEAAFDVASIDSKVADRALQESQQSGLAPEAHVLGEEPPSMDEISQRIKDFSVLDQAPLTKAFVSENPVHGSSMLPGVRQYADLEFYLTGPDLGGKDYAYNEEPDSVMDDMPVPNQTEAWIKEVNKQNVWRQGLTKWGFKMSADGLATIEFVHKYLLPLPVTLDANDKTDGPQRAEADKFMLERSAQMNEVSESKNPMLADQETRTVGDLASNATRNTSDFVAGIWPEVALMVTEPWAAGTLAFVHSLGESERKGYDPTVSLVSAGISAWIMSKGAEQIFGRAMPAGKAADFAEAIARSVSPARGPTFAAVAGKGVGAASKGALAGFLMVVANAATDNLNKQFNERLSKGKGFDYADWDRTMWAAIKSGKNISVLAAVPGLYAAFQKRGNIAIAAEEASRIRGAAREVQSLLAGTDRSIEGSTAKLSADALFDSVTKIDPDFAKFEVDPDEFRKRAKARGLNPEALAEEVSGKKGSLRVAETVGGNLSVDGKKWLTRYPELAQELAESTRFAKRKAGAAVPVTLAQHGTPDPDMPGVPVGDSLREQMQGISTKSTRKPVPGQTAQPPPLPDDDEQTPLKQQLDEAGGGEVEGHAGSAIDAARRTHDAMIDQAIKQALKSSVKEGAIDQDVEAVVHEDASHKGVKQQIEKAKEGEVEGPAAKALDAIRREQDAALDHDLKAALKIYESESARIANEGEAYKGEQEGLDAVHAEAQKLIHQYYATSAAVPSTATAVPQEAAAEAPRPKSNPELRRMYAEDALKGSTIDELKRARYQDQADRDARAQRFAQQRAVDELAKAEQTAQQGIDIATKAKHAPPLVQVPKPGEPPEPVPTNRQRAEDRGVAATKKTVGAGDFAQDAQDAEESRAQNQALADHQEDLLEAADKAYDTTKLLENKAYRTDTFKGGQDYGDAGDALAYSLGLGKAKGDPAAFDRLKASGETLKFDADLIRNIVAKPRPFDDLTPGEADEVAAAVKNIRQLAKAASKTYKAGAIVERSDAIAQMSEYINAARPNTDFTMQPKGWEKLSTPTRTWEAHKANESYLLHVLGGEQGWGQSLEDRLRNARTQESDLRQLVVNTTKNPKAVEKMADQRVPLPPVDDPGVVKRMQMFYGTDMTRADLWRMAGMTASEEGMKAMSRGLQMSPSSIDNYLRDNMSKAEFDAVQQRLDLMDVPGADGKTLFQKLRETNEGRNAIPMELKTGRARQGPDGTTYKGGYDSFRWYDRPDGILNTPDPQNPMGGTAGGKDTRHPWTETQSDTFTALPDWHAASLPGHYKALTHDIAFSEPVRDAARMLNDSTFKQMAQSKLGPAYYDALKTWWEGVRDGSVQTDVRGASEVNNAFKVRGVEAGYAQEVNQQIARTTFAYNMPVKALQLSHLGVAWDQIGVKPGDFMDGVLDAMRPEKIKANFDASDLVRTRWQTWNAQYLDMQRQFAGGSTPFRDGLEVLDRGMNHYLDGFLTNATFNMGMTKALKGGASYDEARLFADRAVDMIMPSMNVTQRSAFSNDKWVGMWTIAKNYGNQISNLRAINAWDRDIRVGQSGQIVTPYLDWMAKSVGMTAAVGLGAYLVGEHGDPSETALQRVGENALTSHFYGDPFMHWLASEVAPSIVKGDYSAKRMGQSLVDFPISERAQRLAKDFQVVGNLAKREKPLDEKFFAAIDMSGQTMNLPPPSLTRMGKGAYMLFNEDSSMWKGYRTQTDLQGQDRRDLNFVDKASMVGYGPRKWKTPLNDLGSFEDAIGTKNLTDEENDQ